jgi:drug/metabolite transporter (DMT)-like permease
MAHRGKTVDSRGAFYVSVALLGWASVLLFLRHLAPHIDVWTANGWRYGMCGLALLPMVGIGRRRGLAPPDIWRRAIPPAVVNSLGQVCFGAMIYFIQPGLAGFLLRFSLVSSTFGAFALFADERVLLRSWIFWSGMLLLVLGSLATIFLGVQPIEGDTVVGVLLGAASGLWFGLYGVAVRYTMHGVPPLYSFSAISSLTALVMVVLMLTVGRRHGLMVLELSWPLIGWLVVSAVIGIAIGHIFYYEAIARLGVAVSGAIVQLAPFLTGAGSVIVFGEILTAWQWLGGVVMLVGSAVLLRAEQQRSRPPPGAEETFPVELEDAGDPTALAAEACRPREEGSAP